MIYILFTDDSTVTLRLHTLEFTLKSFVFTLMEITNKIQALVVSRFINQYQGLLIPSLALGTFYELKAINLVVPKIFNHRKQNTKKRFDELCSNQCTPFCSFEHLDHSFKQPCLVHLTRCFASISSVQCTLSIGSLSTLDTTLLPCSINPFT